MKSLFCLMYLVPDSLYQLRKCDVILLLYNYSVQIYCSRLEAKTILQMNMFCTGSMQNPHKSRIIYF